MERKILIEKRENRIRTFFLEDGDIVEIHSAAEEAAGIGSHRLGDVYVGKVKNIVPNIGAAFIEIEKGVNCYYDMKDAENSFFTHKSGKRLSALVMSLSFRSAGKQSRRKRLL